MHIINPYSFQNKFMSPALLIKTFRTTQTNLMSKIAITKKTNMHNNLTCEISIIYYNTFKRIFYLNAGIYC